MKIVVNVKPAYYNELRDDISCHDYFNTEAVFEIPDDDEADIHDHVRMFIKAMEVEGYYDTSIAQAMFEQALCIAHNNEIKLKTEPGDEDLIE